VRLKRITKQIAVIGRQRKRTLSHVPNELAAGSPRDTAVLISSFCADLIKKIIKEKQKCAPTIIRSARIGLSSEIGAAVLGEVMQEV
jgi:hypothetical protein